MEDTWAWAVFFLILVSIFAMLIFQVICLTDVELDYRNPYESAVLINKVVLPEFISFGILCFLFLATGHWIMFLLSSPYLYYNIRLYLKKQHLVDVTEIFNTRNREKMRRFIKLGYIMFVLIICLFWILYSILDQPDE